MSTTGLQGATQQQNPYSVFSGQTIPSFDASDFYMEGRNGSRMTASEALAKYKNIMAGPPAWWSNENNGDWYANSSDYTNLTLNPNAVGKYFPQWKDSGLSQNNWKFGQDLDGNLQLLIKTGEGDKGARTISFKREGDKWVPNQTGDLQKWDTNDGAQNRALATLAAIAAGGALASGYFPPGAEGAAAAGGAPTTGLQGATAGASGGATTGQYSLAQGVGFNGMPYTSSLAVPSTIGQSALLPAGMSTAGTAGLAAAGIPISSGLGMVTPAAVNAAMNAGALVPTNLANAAGLAGPATVPNQGGSVPSSPSPTGPRTPGMPGGVPGGSQTPGGSRSNLGNLLNILAGLYGADGARDYARDLKEQAARMRVEADPYLRRLQESYDNPNAYFESPEAKAMLGIEANRLTGIDSARGNLSNDIGRTKLLQDYGAARMNDYRTGLRGAISNIYKPEAVAQLYGAASRTENNQWAGLASAMGNVTGGQGGVGSVDDWIKDIRGIVDGGKEVYDWIKSWF